MRLPGLSRAAVCGALLSLSSSASAQSALVERLRLQGGYISVQRPAPERRVEDVWVGAVPELTLFWEQPSTVLSLTYSLTGAVHSFAGASEIANRVALAASFELTNRTTLLLSVTAAQTTLSNLLISQPASGSAVALYPGAANRLVLANAFEVLRHELTPRVIVDQSADAAVMTTLPGSPPIDSFFGSAGLGFEHVWPYDGVGGEVRGGYANVRTVTPPLVQQYFTLAATPHWRHDWSPSLSSFLSAGGSILVSPEAGTKPLIAPSGRASILYTWGTTTIDLTYTTGFFPSPITGQMLRSHQVQLHGVTPLSEPQGIYLGGGVGYLNGSLVDLRDPGNSQRFDTVLCDVDVTWHATPLTQLFARYQFTAQDGEATVAARNPSFLRDLFLVGVQFSSRPSPRGGTGGTGPGEVRTRFPQRVDGSDGAEENDNGDQGRDADANDPQNADDPKSLAVQHTTPPGHAGQAKPARPRIHRRPMRPLHKRPTRPRAREPEDEPEP